jgi:hypothetical protein
MVEVVGMNHFYLKMKVAGSPETLAPSPRIQAPTSL